MDNKELSIGHEKRDLVNIKLKPSYLKNWRIVKETEKCLVIRKRFDKRYGKKDYLGDCNYIPKKNIDEIDNLTRKKKLKNLFEDD